MDLQNIAEKTLNKAKASGSDKALVSVSSTMAKEFNVEANKLTLLRTTFDQTLGLKTLVDQRQSTISGNQFTEDAASQLATHAVAAAKASPQDEANGFAPSQGHKKFSFGNTEVNEEWMYARLRELLDERKKLFPKVIIEGSTIKFLKTDRLLMTSEGTVLNSSQSHYEGFVMFTAKEGVKSSSFNYIGFHIGADEAGKPISLMRTCGLSDLLGQCSEQLHVQKVPANFEGDLILTPHCLEEFAGAWKSYLGSGRMLKKSSFFEGKLGEKVASSSWTLTSNPVDSPFATRRFWTSDGYLTKNETIFENGVLKRYLLDHYSATKLKQAVSQSEGDYLKLAPGKSSLKDMIASVKKGVLMCRYSAGAPAENGDVSGVAKNSYFIEDGAIKYPLGETMVTANFSKLLNEVKDISRETLTSGYWEMPWVRFSGVNVS